MSHRRNVESVFWSGFRASSSLAGEVAVYMHNVFLFTRHLKWLYVCMRHDVCALMRIANVAIIYMRATFTPDDFDYRRRVLRCISVVFLAFVWAYIHIYIYIYYSHTRRVFGSQVNCFMSLAAYYIGPRGYCVIWTDYRMCASVCVSVCICLAYEMVQFCRVIFKESGNEDCTYVITKATLFIYVCHYIYACSMTCLRMMARFCYNGSGWSSYID